MSLGRLRHNHLAIRQFGRDSRDSDVTGLAQAQIDFIEERWQLAREVLTFAQEVAVDKLIAALYPQFLDTYLIDRLRFYENGEAYPYRDRPSLNPYRSFYRLLRMELGLAVVLDTTARAALEGRRAATEHALQTTLTDPRFRDQRAKYSAITIDTDDPDPDPYRELFDRVLAEAVPT